VAKIVEVKPIELRRHHRAFERPACTLGRLVSFGERSRSHTLVHSRRTAIPVGRCLRAVARCQHTAPPGTMPSPDNVVTGTERPARGGSARVACDAGAAWEARIVPHLSAKPRPLYNPA
jgi:hypothetical protein